MDDVEWSDWIPFSEALASAPRVPGVYMAREGDAGEIVYIGMAGERSGGGKPQGIRGRLAIYASGKGLASGLGEAVFDRALADPEWVKARMVELDTSGPRRAKQWGIEAFARADLHIRWTTTANKAAAAALEDRLVRGAGGTLWNRASTRLVKVATGEASTAQAVAVHASLVKDGATTQRVLRTGRCSRRSASSSRSSSATRRSCADGTRRSGQESSGPACSGHQAKFSAGSLHQKIA